MFIQAYNLTMQDKERLLTDTKEVIQLLTNTETLDEKITSIKNEIDIISELVRKLVKQNSTEAQSQEEYQKKYNDLSERYNKLKDELDKLINNRAYKLGQSTKLEAFLKEMETAETTIDTWNDELWMIMVESAVVHKDKSITFKFYNGKEIRIYSQKAIQN